VIGQLQGTVASVGAETLILDVGGVGYEVAATPRLLARLEPGTPARLSIETQVAETYIRLVGFDNDTERRMFRLLQTVQGVGAKAALSILHVLPVGELLDAISLGDKTAVARAQGVGPKLALRVVTELKSKVGGVLGAENFAPASKGERPSPPDDPIGPARRDAVAALLALGYDESVAMRTIAGLPRGEEERTDALVTAALRELAAS
jgi:Holliday junction DNA helicase RuvA